MTVHVKNTGRCRELLLPGAQVYLEKSENLKRKTPYSLIAVKKNGRLFNIDSQAPNRVAAEALKTGRVPFLGGKFAVIRPEYPYGKSRLDFYLETEDGRQGLMEVKGVTLEKRNVALFPDAPTERGVKHVEELIAATQKGFAACVLFVVQFRKAAYFMPNSLTHPAFQKVLVAAKKAGVELIAMECQVDPDSLAITTQVPIAL